MHVQDLPLEGHRTAAAGAGPHRACWSGCSPSRWRRTPPRRSSTELLGTQVDIGKLDIMRRRRPRWICSALQMADPFDLAKNLRRGRSDQAQAESRGAGGEEVRGGALRPERNAVRHHPEDAGAAGRRRWLRATGAPRRASNGRSSSTCRSSSSRRSTRSSSWCSTLPSSRRCRTAQALVARTDSTRKAAGAGVPAARRRGHGGLRPARSRTRLSATDPRKLGLDGTRKAIEDVQANLKQIDEAKKRIEALERQVQGGVRGLRHGPRGARRGPAEGLRLRQVPAAAAVVRRPGDRRGVLRQGQHRPLSEGPLLDRAGAPLHAARAAAARGSRARAPARLGQQRSDFPRSRTGRSSWCSSARWTSTVGGDSPLQRGLRGDRAGADLRPVALRQADDRPHQPDARRAARSRASRWPPSSITCTRSGCRTPPRRDSGASSCPRFDIPGLPFRLDPGHRGRQPRLRAPRTTSSPAAGQSPPTRSPGRWTAPGGKLNDAGGAGLAGGLRAQEPVGGRPGERRDCARRSSRSAATSIGRSRERLQAVIGEEVAKAEKMVRAKVDSVVAERVEPVQQADPRGAERGGAAPGIGAEAGGGRGARAPGGAQAAHRRTGARHQAAQDRHLRSPGPSGRVGRRA